MADIDFDLKKLRILICNDDGLNAVGIKELEEIARSLTNDVWIVAPETDQSGTGHSLTIRSPLNIKTMGKKCFSVNGTPTDCIILAMNKILKDHRPDFVLSGINRGVNLGEDVTYSGTIGAAIEATLFGVPSIAMSQEYNDAELIDEWGISRKYGAKILKKLLLSNWPKDVLININFPCVSSDQNVDIEITREGRQKIGDEVIEQCEDNQIRSFWIGKKKKSNSFINGTDLAAIKNGNISITPISINLTHKSSIKKLKKVFNE
ncbi:MAG: 5'/3'-nucleotidase SurE [Rhodospirillales bacterium]|tara:strand:- start:5159 stop:5947 length:789 start_codon:yes stop_codon:yes gene_type:complete